MRLNRWVWIGVLLSIIWAVGAAVNAHKSDIERANNWVKLSYDTCTSSKEMNHDADLSSCEAERKTTFKTWMDGSNTNAAIVALGPIPFAWFAVFLLSYAIRAQNHRVSCCRTVEDAHALKKIICCVLLGMYRPCRHGRCSRGAESLRRYEGAGRYE